MNVFYHALYIVLQRSVLLCSCVQNYRSILKVFKYFLKYLYFKYILGTSICILYFMLLEYLYLNTF